MGGPSAASLWPPGGSHSWRSCDRVSSRCNFKLQPRVYSYPLRYNRTTVNYLTLNYAHSSAADLEWPPAVGIAAVRAAGADKASAANVLPVLAAHLESSGGWTQTRSRDISSLVLS
jgi:hypothetical protein